MNKTSKSSLPITLNTQIGSVESVKFHLTRYLSFIHSYSFSRARCRPLNDNVTPIPILHRERGRTLFQKRAFAQHMRFLLLRRRNDDQNLCHSINKLSLQPYLIIPNDLEIRGEETASKLILLSLQAGNSQYKAVKAYKLEFKLIFLK